MITKQEKMFIIQNREMVLGILNKYLEHYKNVIWKEKDLSKKAENSAIADRIEDLIITIKGLKIETPDKQGGKFTGV